MVLAEKLFTADDLWKLSHLPENEGKRLELIEGVIIEMAPAGSLHGGIAGDVLGFIWTYVRQKKIGRVMAAETGFSLTGDGLNVLAPDVGFISAERVPDELPVGFFPFAPDLAVEVVSPGNTSAEIHLKVDKFLQYGTKIVWIFHPKEKTVAVYRAMEGQASTVEFLNVDGVLDGGDVLPGFTLPVKDCFP
jgi:Uma2 family endonuclease